MRTQSAGKWGLSGCLAVLSYRTISLVLSELEFNINVFIHRNEGLHSCQLCLIYMTIKQLEFLYRCRRSFTGCTVLSLKLLPKDSRGWMMWVYPQLQLNLWKAADVYWELLFITSLLGIPFPFKTDFRCLITAVLKSPFTTGNLIVKSKNKSSLFQKKKISEPWLGAHHEAARVPCHSTSDGAGAILIQVFNMLVDICPEYWL